MFVSSRVQLLFLMSLIGVLRVKRGKRSCWLAWIRRSVILNQGTIKKNVAAPSLTHTLSPLSSCALFW